MRPRHHRSRRADRGGTVSAVRLARRGSCVLMKPRSALSAPVKRSSLRCRAVTESTHCMSLIAEGGSRTVARTRRSLRFSTSQVSGHRRMSATCPRKLPWICFFEAGAGWNMRITFSRVVHACWSPRSRHRRRRRSPQTTETTAVCCPCSPPRGKPQPARQYRCHKRPPTGSLTSTAQAPK